MTHKEHNGWTNYETWIVKLWMDNEEGTHLYFREQAERVIKEDGLCDRDSDRVRTLADIIQQEHEDNLPKLEGFAVDLMNSALSEVNWEEIAYSLLEDAKEAMEA